MKKIYLLINGKELYRNEKDISFDKWERTIMDIRTDSAENYCQDIKDWAFGIEKILNKDYSNEREQE